MNNSNNGCFYIILITLFLALIGYAFGVFYQVEYFPELLKIAEQTNTVISATDHMCAKYAPIIGAIGLPIAVYLLFLSTIATLKD